MTGRLGSQAPRDHGGGLDAAIREFGGTREDWIDLSTGINPVPYPLCDVPMGAWTALPDAAAFASLERAARQVWSVPKDAAVLAAPGASALIARLPALKPAGQVHIPTPTYNEHFAAFHAHGWSPASDAGTPPDAKVIVHPNNPDGRLWTPSDATAPFTIIDESFCDISPEHSLIHLATRPGTIVLKSFGKFWGLAGLRLGFAIGDPDLLAQLSEFIGPWAVSGPALQIGAAALEDRDWAQATRYRLQIDADRLDTLMTDAGASVVGGTSLFRLYQVPRAKDWQDRLAQHHIWSRIFPYSGTWLRLGLPPSHGWTRLEEALR